MIQCLRVLAAVTKDPGSIASIHAEQLTNTWTPLSEDLTAASGFWGYLRAQDVHTDTRHKQVHVNQFIFNL